MASASVCNSWELRTSQGSSSTYIRFTLSYKSIQISAFLLISQVIKGRRATNCAVKIGTDHCHVHPSVVRQRLVCSKV